MTLARMEGSIGIRSAHDFWFIFGFGNAGLLRPGGSKPLVYLSIRRGMRIRVGVRLPSRGLAVWTSRGNLVHCCAAALVAGDCIGTSSGKKMR
jgi:hypothetical protein